MSKRKAIASAGASLWFCPDGHLHISLVDDAGEEVAFTALQMEEGLEAIADLLVDLDEDHGITLHSISEDDDQDDPLDTIGPTEGSC